MKDRRQHFAHRTDARVFTGQNDLNEMFPALLGLAKPAFLQTFDVIVDLINFRRIADGTSGGLAHPFSKMLRDIWSASTSRLGGFERESSDSPDLRPLGRSAAEIADEAGFTLLRRPPRLQRKMRLSPWLSAAELSLRDHCSSAARDGRRGLGRCGSEPPPRHLLLSAPLR